MQISRLFEIVYILMNKKVETARELSAHFEVSQRTIYRDIETLCEAGIPIYTSKGKGGGIRIMEHFVLNKSVLSEKEQSDILSALQGLKATSFSDTDQVLTKLNSLFGNKGSDWIEVDFSYWSSTEEDKSKFKALKDAILNRNVLEFDYYNTKGEESHRIVEPTKLIFKGQAWYLYCYCRERLNMRYFKISRIKALRTLNESFSPREAVVIEDNASFPNNAPTVNVVLIIDSDMAYRIFDEYPKESISSNTDGTFTVKAELQAGGWLTGYLMSYEEHIKILEPSWLRDQIIQKYETILEKYKN